MRGCSPWRALLTSRLARLQYLGDLDCDFVVITNDQMSVEEVRDLQPRGILVSPGPGEPPPLSIIPQARAQGQDGGPPAEWESPCCSAVPGGLHSLGPQCGILLVHVT